MSDDGYCGYEDDVYFDEDPYGTADDLAEHALPSPVWISYEPDFDAQSFETDWEDYFTDEYFDEGVAEVKKRAQDVQKDLGQQQRETQTRKVLEAPALSDVRQSGKRQLSLEPTVVWKRGEESLQTLWTDEDAFKCEGKKVALLKDWREKFPMNHTSDIHARGRADADVKTNYRNSTGPLRLEEDTLKQKHTEDNVDSILPPLSIANKVNGDQCLRDRIGEDDKVPKSTVMPPEHRLMTSIPTLERFGRTDKESVILTAATGQW